jgi:hypothetical protein
MPAFLSPNTDVGVAANTDKLLSLYSSSKDFSGQNTNPCYPATQMLKFYRET